MVLGAHIHDLVPLDVERRVKLTGRAQPKPTLLSLEAMVIVGRRGRVLFSKTKNSYNM